VADFNGPAGREDRAACSGKPGKPDWLRGSEAV
jgi:hypothetical protein